MTFKGFLFIIASALFHVLWNSSLKMSDDKPSAVLLMMVVTVSGFVPWVLWWSDGEALFVPRVFLSAFAAGFFFFLYQYFVALSYDKGDLTLVYPLTVTGPVYIVLWSHLFLGERISLAGALGIILIIYGAVTLQTGRFNFFNGGAGCRNLFTRKRAGALTALCAAFFYSFGAVADKIGVMSGNILLYTMTLSVIMLIFHLARMVCQKQTGSVVGELKANPLVVAGGGVVMLLSFITFRIGLEEVYASYASALRQVSTLFGLGIGYLVFREALTLRRVVSSCLIVAGAVLIKMG
ncbi:MAG: EamA family transporter [Desulfobacteraceae bacterium]|nr:EamA family transporter [Desulfobacteraceae bacterium]